MNSALERLYDGLTNEANLQVEGRLEEEITEAEKAKRFLEEKRVAVEKLKELSLKRVEEETQQKEQRRLEDLERRRQAIIDEKNRRKQQEQEQMKEIEEKTKCYWKRDITGKRQETGVTYFGDLQQCGDAWVPHGQGEYRVKGEMKYEGEFSEGMMHGDMVHGIGVLESRDDTKRKAIYWKDHLVCFLDELQPGVRLKLLGDAFSRQSGRTATLVGPTSVEGRYQVQLDDGENRLVRLDYEHFHLLRTQPSVFLLETVVGSTRPKDLYNYEQDMIQRQTTDTDNKFVCENGSYKKNHSQRPIHKSAYRENWYWPDLWAGREKAEREKQAQLDLQKMRSRILSQRQQEKDNRTAQDNAARVAHSLEEEEKRRDAAEEEERAQVEAEKQELLCADGAVQEQKRRHRELSYRRPGRVAEDSPVTG